MGLSFSSFRQAHHVCVRGQQWECWRNCSSPTDSPTVFRTSTLCQRPTKERQGLCTRDVEANPSCCFILFSFPFRLKPSSLGTSPSHLHRRPPSLGLPSSRGTSPLAAWGEERGRRGDRSSSEGRSLPSHCHLIQSRHHWPSNAKGAGERWWIDHRKSPTFPEKFYLLSLCSCQNKLFQRTSHQGWFLISHCPHSVVDVLECRTWSKIMWRWSSSKWKVEFLRIKWESALLQVCKNRLQQDAKRSKNKHKTSMHGQASKRCLSRGGLLSWK